MHRDVQPSIDGTRGPAASGRPLTVVNPATGEPAGSVAHAGPNTTFVTQAGL